MKVAFFLSVFPSLTETWIINQITGLIDLGHEITIYTRSSPMGARVHPDITEYDLSSRVRSLDIPASMSRRVLKGAVLALRGLIRQPRRTLSSLNYFRYGPAVLSLTPLYASFLPRDEEFDILHCHFGPNGLIGSFLLDEGWKADLVVTFHGFDVNSYPRTAGPNVYRKLFARRDAFTANTRFTRSQMVKLGCDERKVAILPMSISIDRFDFSEKTLAEGERVKVLSVGRLCEKKGFAYGIMALAKLAARGYDFEYTLIGDGPLREGLEQLAAEMGIEDRVRFVGGMTQAEVARAFTESHIFLGPSVTASDGDREGQGVVFQEAQAAGLPVVSTLHNGIPEGVLQDKSALLVPEKDADALYDKLAWLFDHPSEWAAMGRAGREFVESRYSPAVLNRRLVEIYEAAASGDGRPLAELVED